MSVRSLASALLSVIALSAISCISTGAPPEFEAREHRVVGNEANTQGDWDLAISEYTRAIELDPTAHDYSERAYAHAGLGNVEAAITDYTDAIALDDQSGLAYSQRALLYNELGAGRRRSPTSIGRSSCARNEPISTTGAGSPT